jgi:hypothetical protein
MKKIKSLDDLKKAANSRIEELEGGRLTDSDVKAKELEGGRLTDSDVKKAVMPKPALKIPKAKIKSSTDVKKVNSVSSPVKKVIVKP